MTYPKKVMSLKELAEYTGLPKKYFIEAYRSPDNNFAWKMNPGASNSKIMFDTEEFDAWRLRKLKAEVSAMRRRGCGVA